VSILNRKFYSNNFLLFMK